jgi:hypothetical protein
MINIIGSITNPLEKTYGSFNEPGLGIVLLVTNILRLIFVAAGIYALLNIIIGGYQYMSAGGDSKQLSAAWSRIWQTLLGLIIIIGSFALAGIIGFLFFGDANFILKPVIYGP